MATMIDPLYSTIAIMLTGLEEIILRTTISHRDTWFQSKFQNNEHETYEEQAFRLYCMETMWANSISCSMVCEATAIMSRFSAVYLLQPHRFVFMIGFPQATLSTIEYFNVILEIVSEIVVDLIACYAEIKQNIRVSGVFGSIMSSWTYFHMLGALMTGCLFSLLILTHVPNLLSVKMRYLCALAVSTKYILNTPNSV